MNNNKLLLVLLVLLLITNLGWANGEKIIISSLTQQDLVTLSHQSSINNELIYKVSGGNPTLIKVARKNYFISETLRGEIYSRDYTISCNGDIAYLSEDKLCLSFYKSSKKSIIEGPPCYSPSWSPDGVKLAYSHKSQVIYYDLKTQEKQIICKEKSGGPMWLSNDVLLYTKNWNLTQFDVRTKKENILFKCDKNYIIEWKTFDSKEGCLYFVYSERKAKGNSLIQKYSFSAGALEDITDGSYIIAGLVKKQNNNGLCLIDKQNKNRMIYLNLTTIEPTIIEENYVFDAVTTYNGDAVLYATYGPEKNIYLYRFD